MRVVKKVLLVAGVAGVAGAVFSSYKLSKKVKAFKEEFEYPITFSGKEEKVTTDFKGGTFGVLFSGLRLDLSNAKMSLEEVHLKLTGEYSGISIIVPRDWNVKVVGVADKSGVNLRVDNNEDDIESKRLNITYDLKYSGLEVIH